MKFSLELPREAFAIKVVRRVLGDALRTLGVAEDCIHDILLAVAEACSNVVRHARPTRCYEVMVAVTEEHCFLRVADRGPGLRDIPPPTLEGESGRGIQIMRAVVDDVAVDTQPGQGTIVHLHKRLDWRDGAPMTSLADR